ncbi:MAG: dTDP-4-dehydrorhamnose 3,5-epimerase [Bacteroidetes bacterium]|jgi:dTDP-4-dehydrorhamnose 3,5-epimerase|nr:dTDP-4-dehydrorhamnose 3,5-epimerase [Bacteroidota bacterium]
MSLYTLQQTPIEGCYEIKPRVFQDNRGKFIKIFHEGLFKENNLVGHFEEEYISESEKGVLRGLHFQTPPYAHVKVVSCIYGKILDVVVDIRKDSSTYGQAYSIELSSEKNNMLYVPEGLAHGFYVLSDKALFLSMNSKKYAPDYDSGIRWDSFDFDWPDKDPILSEKDKNLPELKNYKSPF